MTRLIPILTVAVVASGCAPAPPEPPVTIGTVTLSVDDLVSERYRLTVPLFNRADTPLRGFTVVARADVRSGSTQSPQRSARIAIPVRHETESRSRGVHAVTFDCPFTSVPAGGIVLRDVAFSDFVFGGHRTWRPVRLDYEVPQQ